MSLFNEAMACDSQMMKLALKDHNMAFQGLESIVDVGGGTGTTAQIISEYFPKLKFIVFDLPHVVKGLKASNNLSFVGGVDMFESIPKADAILLKFDRIIMAMETTMDPTIPVSDNCHNHASVSWYRRTDIPYLTMGLRRLSRKIHADHVDDVMMMSWDGLKLQH